MTFFAFADDGDERDLTAFRLCVIGENANKLSDELKERNPHLPWHKMYGLRNLVVHEYRAIKPQRMWEAVQDLETIKAMCEAELAAFT